MQPWWANPTPNIWMLVYGLVFSLIAFSKSNEWRLLFLKEVAVPSLPRVENSGKLLVVELDSSHQLKSNLVTFTPLNNPLTPSGPSAAVWLSLLCQKRWCAFARVIQRAAQCLGVRMYSVYNLKNECWLNLQSQIEVTILAVTGTLRALLWTLRGSFLCSSKIVRNALIATIKEKRNKLFIF